MYNNLGLDEFAFFRNLIGEVAGISLGDSKIDLVSTRLRSRLSHLGLPAFRDYQQLLQSLPLEHPELQTFINLMTTNKTDFFREPKHFDYLSSQFIPEWLKLNRETLSIWCAASSTGEEPYTLAMVLDQAMPKDRDFKIIATDIDTKVLSVAQNAVYPASKINEIPESIFKETCTAGTAGLENWFRIRPHIKNKVSFERHNLIEPGSLGEEAFDLVFCRNVLIYFSRPTIEFVANKLFLSTKRGGYFFTGHSESLQGTRTEWKSERPAIYRKIKS